MGKLFGKSRKTPSFAGTKPFTSLKEIEEGRLFSGELKRRVRGEGVGFDPRVISGATAPFAVARRRALKEQTIPLISAQASARGVGRSTIPVSRIGLESSRAEQDISQRIANLSLANEQQRRNEINAALSGLGGFTQAEAAQRGRRGEFEFREFTRFEKARERKEDLARAGQGRMLALAAAAVGGFIAGPAGALAGSQIASGASAMSTGDLTSFLSMLQGQSSGALVQGGALFPTQGAGTLGGAFAASR